MQLRAYAWAKDPSAGFELKCEVLRNVKKRYDDMGIYLAHPYRMVVMQEQKKDRNTTM
jgi:small-conductance mechanosensitive channel